MATTNSPAPKLPAKLRAACDACHAAKSKCSRGMPCAECALSGAHCSYSPPTQLGRPKGSKNKGRGHGRAGSSETMVPWVGPFGGTYMNAFPNQSTSVGGSEMSEQYAFSYQTDQEPYTQLDDVQSNQTNNSTARSNETFKLTSGALRDDDGSMSHYSSTAKGPHRELHSMSGLEAAAAMLQTETSATQSTSSHSCADPSQRSFVPDSDHSGLSFLALSNSMDMVGGSSTTNTSCTSPSHPQTTTLTGDPSADNKSPAMTQTCCGCTQKHIELLYQLQPITLDNTCVPADSILRAARWTLEHWNSLLLCKACRHDKNNGAHLLSAMSMRIVVRRAMSMQADLGNPTLQVPPPRILVGTFDVSGEDHQTVIDVLVRKALERLHQALNFIERPQREDAQKSSTSAASGLLAHSPV